jgi:hypothetical protein
LEYGLNLKIFALTAIEGFVRLPLMKLYEKTPEFDEGYSE